MTGLKSHDPFCGRSKISDLLEFTSNRIFKNKIHLKRQKNIQMADFHVQISFLRIICPESLKVTYQLIKILLWSHNLLLKWLPLPDSRIILKWDIRCIFIEYKFGGGGVLLALVMSEQRSARPKSKDKDNPWPENREKDLRYSLRVYVPKMPRSLTKSLL